MAADLLVAAGLLVAVVLLTAAVVFTELAIGFFLGDTLSSLSSDFRFCHNMRENIIMFFILVCTVISRLSAVPERTVFSN